MHTAAELFRQSTQTTMTHVPFNGAGPRPPRCSRARFRSCSNWSPASPLTSRRTKSGARGHGAPALGGASRRADHGRGRFPENRIHHLVLLRRAQGHAKAVVDSLNGAVTDSGAARFLRAPGRDGVEPMGGTPAEFATFLDAEIKVGRGRSGRRSRDRVSASVMPAAKTALVIGGSDVSVGIGAIVALARTQATLAVHCAPTKVEPIHARLRAGLAPAISFYEADLASAKSIDAMMSRVLAELGHIDILINGGGVQYAGPLESMPVERWEQDIAVNLSACFHTCRRVLPGMRERNWGASSTCRRRRASSAPAARRPTWRPSMGRSVWRRRWPWELVQTGITVNAICRGWVENSSFLVQQRANAPPPRA